MGVTFGQMRTKVGDWLTMDLTRLPDTVRGDLVNMARREIQRKYDLRFNENFGTLTTVANDPTQALPANWSRNYWLWYINPISGDKVDIDQRQPSDWFDKYPDFQNPGSITTPGNPIEYCVFGDNLYLGPVPSTSGLAINWLYYTVPTDFVVGADDNNTDDLLTLSWEAVLWKACLLAEVYGVEDARMQTFQGMYDEAIRDLVHEHVAAKTAGGRIQAVEYGSFAGTQTNNTPA